MDSTLQTEERSQSHSVKAHLGRQADHAVHCAPGIEPHHLRRNPAPVRNAQLYRHTSLRCGRVTYHQFALSAG